MKYDAIIFDFDGTIADTQKVLLESVNPLASEFGFARIDPNEISELKRMSARTLLVKRLGIPLWNVWKIYRIEKRVRQELNARAKDIRVFNGMPDVIAKLHDARMRVGILSSNAASIVMTVTRGASIQIDFFDTGSKALGKARALRRCLRRHALAPSRVLYVGDELRDLEACKKVGIDMIAVGWGFNDAPTLRQAGLKVADNPAELSRLLLTDSTDIDKVAEQIAS